MKVAFVNLDIGVGTDLYSTVVIRLCKKVLDLKFYRINKCNEDCCGVCKEIDKQSILISSICTEDTEETPGTLIDFINEADSKGLYLFVSCDFDTFDYIMDNAIDPIKRKSLN